MNGDESMKEHFLKFLKTFCPDNYNHICNDVCHKHIEICQRTLYTPTIYMNIEVNVTLKNILN